MRSRLKILLVLLYFLALGIALVLQFTGRPDFPLVFSSVAERARQEGEVTIWSVTDSRRVAGLLAEFRRRNPGIAVHYIELPALDLYDRFRAEADAGQGTADILWSSAMDLQIKLVNDGYSQRYLSPERRAIPSWAVWKNEAWGITAEPIVFAYNRRMMRDFPAIPDTHPDLIQFLRQNADALRGKVATYDPAHSAVGYLYLAQDVQANLDTWDLVSALGNADARLYPSSEEILDAIGAGKLAFAYDMIGSYALEAQQRNPDIGVVVPRDYSLVMSRIAMIPKRARHPYAARLFLDFLLSEDGQKYLSEHNMTPVRNNLPDPSHLQLDRSSARAIRVGPALLVHQDRLTREKFLRDWSRALSQN